MTMLATIELPAGTDKVTVRDIPALIADALHPAISEDTPRQITRLQKMPTTADNAANWCGAGCQPFPVSLTDEDMAELAAGVWASLPPLVLPTPESQWQSYIDSYHLNPPTGWELVTVSVAPSLNALVLWHNTKSEWSTTVRNEAMRGHLTPRHPTTFLPQPQAGGEWLLDCFVTVADLTEFAKRFDIAVTVEPDNRFSWQLKAQAKEKESAGRYTLEEAAKAIDLHTGDRAGPMQEKLIQAVRDGSLSVYEPGQQGSYQPKIVRAFYEEAYWTDLNEWLEKYQKRIDWRFPAPSLQHVVAGDTTPDEPKPAATITTHRLKTRSNPLDAVIELATKTALAPDDTQSVWAALVVIAEQKEKPAPLIGYSSDGIQYRGKKYETTEVPDVFTAKHLRDRMARAKAR